MPKVWFPDIDPEASNTIMASCLQGAILPSSPRAKGLHAKESTRTATAVRQVLRTVEVMFDSIGTMNLLLIQFDAFASWSARCDVMGQSRVFSKASTRSCSLLAAM